MPARKFISPCSFQAGFRLSEEQHHREFGRWAGTKHVGNWGRISKFVPSSSRAPIPVPLAPFLCRFLATWDTPHDMKNKNGNLHLASKLFRSCTKYRPLFFFCRLPASRLEDHAVHDSQCGDISRPSSGVEKILAWHISHYHVYYIRIKLTTDWNLTVSFPVPLPERSHSTEQSWKSTKEKFRLT